MNALIPRITNFCKIFWAIELARTIQCICVRESVCKSICHLDADHSFTGIVVIQSSNNSILQYCLTVAKQSHFSGAIFFYFPPPCLCHYWMCFWLLLQNLCSKQKVKVFRNWMYFVCVFQPLFIRSVLWILIFRGTNYRTEMSFNSITAWSFNVRVLSRSYRKCRIPPEVMMKRRYFRCA